MEACPQITLSSSASSQRSIYCAFPLNVTVWRDPFEASTLWVSSCWQAPSLSQGARDPIERIRIAFTIYRSSLFSPLAQGLSKLSHYKSGNYSANGLQLFYHNRTFTLLMILTALPHQPHTVDEAGPGWSLAGHRARILLVPGLLCSQCAEAAPLHLQHLGVSVAPNKICGR